MSIEDQCIKTRERVLTRDLIGVILALDSFVQDSAILYNGFCLKVSGYTMSFSILEDQAESS